jgi:phage RecT family recombinase
MAAPKTQTPAPREGERQAIRSLEHTLQTMRERLVAALPTHIPVQSFISTILTACSVEPQLLYCDKHSLFLSALKAARDGLMPDGREAALVPFRDNGTGRRIVTYIPMYAGLLKKIRNSGELKSLSANVVFEKDHFEYELGDDEKIIHRPEFKGPRGAMVAAYAIGKTKDGGIYRRVLTAEEIKKIRAFSKAKKGPWSGEFESEMWIKSAIRRLSKIMPMSTDLNQYLNSGPALPATDTEAQLPDALGEEGLESLEFALRTRAMASLSDECPDVNTLMGTWNGIRVEYEKIGMEIPLEVEDKYQMRLEALKAPK